MTSAPQTVTTRPGTILSANEATAIPPGYKQTALGPLPSTWDTVRLGDLFVFKNGLNKAKRFFGTGTPIVNYMDVFEQPGLRTDDLAGRVNLSPEEIKKFEVRLGDVFFTRTSETVEEVGVASVMLDEPHDTVFSGFVLRARPRDDRLDDHYKQYCFAPREVRTQIVSNATYTTRALTNGRSLSNVWLAVPSLPEQHAIAEALSDVDTLLGALEKLIAKKRAIKQAAMQQLLTGKTRLPGFSGEWETKRTEVGIIPRDWECLRLGDVVNLLTGFPFPSSGYTNSGVLLVRGSNVKRGVLDWGDDITKYWPTVTFDIEQYELRKGDLVIAMDGALVGRSYAVISDTDLPSLLLQRVARIRSSQLHQDLLAFLVASDSFINHVDIVKTHTAIPHISPNDIRSFLIAVPANTAEQCAIAYVLSDMDAAIATLERRRDKARAIKQGMMQQLLTGRVRLVSAREGNDHTP